MKYGLIGEKLSHSFSPQIHALFGNSDYETLEIPQDKLDYFMTKRDFCGINVTIPYKKAVMKYCDYISDAAKKIGSVNTIVNHDGILYGYNTDYDGFSYMMSNIDFAGTKLAGTEVALANPVPMKVIILGSGGTSLTAQAVVEDQKGEVYIISRGGKDNYDNIEKHYDCDIIINTTPVGMYPNRDSEPLNIEKFYRLKGVFDVIYNPLRTSFLQQAKEAGIPYMGGLSMLVAQAFFAHQLFFNVKVDNAKLDINEIEKVEKQISKAVKNIVLIGMPGCGKTTVGEALAKKTGLSFVDTDTIVKNKAGIEITEIFKLYGEEYFRTLECDAISEVCENRMQVIATGGGSIVAKANRTKLGWDGIIVWLDRDVKALDTANRPLSSQPDGLIKLYEQRKDIYSNFADIRINCDRPVEDIVNEIIEYI